MTSEPVLSEVTCVVCNEQAEASMTAECNWCDGRYHLNQRSDIEGRDCGRVWIDEQFLALQFACNTCLAEGGSAAPDERAAPRTTRSSGRPRRYKRRA
jgi:hypothetical protein